MIIFDLICANTHIFEGWFGSSHDYKAQQEKGLLSCPHCGSKEVHKSVMAPHVGLKSNQKSRVKPAQTGSTDISETKNIETNINAVNAKPNQVTNMDHNVKDSMNKAVFETLTKIQNEILKDSTWVGNTFAAEARAMHYGESEKRQIHGHVSENQASELSDEGIDIAPLPMPYIPPRLKN